MLPAPFADEKVVNVEENHPDSELEGQAAPGLVALVRYEGPEDRVHLGCCHVVPPIFGWCDPTLSGELRPLQVLCHACASQNERQSDDDLKSNNELDHFQQLFGSILMLDVSKKRWQQKHYANFDAKAHREKECSEKWPSLDQKPDGKENVHSHDLVVEHGRPMCSISLIYLI